MKTCKDCLHYEICKIHGIKVENEKINKEFCGCFADSSEWVHLPDEEYTFTVRGDIAKGLIIANCRAAEMEVKHE